MTTPKTEKFRVVVRVRSTPYCSRKGFHRPVLSVSFTDVSEGTLNVGASPVTRRHRCAHDGQVITLTERDRNDVPLKYGKYLQRLTFVQPPVSKWQVSSVNYSATKTSGP